MKASSRSEASAAALPTACPDHVAGLGRAEEFAALACFLVEHDYINGETVRMDGGLRMAPR